MDCPAKLSRHGPSSWRLYHCCSLFELLLKSTFSKWSLTDIGRCTLLVLGWTPFVYRTVQFLYCTYSNKVLETFLRDSGPCWHDGIIQVLQISQPQIHDVNLLLRALLDSDLLTVEAIWVQGTHWHVQETSLKWNKFCEWGVHWAHNGMEMASNNRLVFKNNAQ